MGEDEYGFSGGDIDVDIIGTPRGISMRWLGIVGSGDVGAGRDGRSLTLVRVLRLARDTD